MQYYITSIQEVIKIIVKTHNSLGHKLKVVVDTNHFTGRYTADALFQMVYFSNATKQYIEKTAVYEDSDNKKMAAEIVAAFSERNDIKTFSTKQDAVEWLAPSHK